jgi:hypothetical protein
MSRPLFSVGEEVTYSCEVFYKYISVFGFKFYRKLPHSSAGEARIVEYGGVHKRTGRHCYRLNGDKIWTCESGLRKKYPPSDQSFTQLLDTLKGRVVA